MRQILLIVSLLCFVSLSFADDLDPKKVEFFEKNIRPVLIEHCYQCHSADSKKLKGELLLDSRWGWQQGGESGSPIVPGEPNESLLLEALRYESFEMPPKAKLPANVIANFEKWIADGAVDPREKRTRTAKSAEAFNLAERSKFWSLQPVENSDVPKVKQTDWPKSDYDRFVLAKLEKKGWKPSKPATKETWIRRVTYDLTGLPPRPDEIADFMADESSAAHAKVVDRLLESKQFGEHWARHWMDLVRYGDSKAYEADYLMANTFRYRDYLIRAFNDDVPYDQFLREAVAGDLIEPRINKASGIAESPIGPGYLYLTDGQHGPPDIHADEARIFEDMIDVVGKAFLGQTIACARCHDHKFDAITAKDYYSLYGVIASSRLDHADVNSPKLQDEYEKRLRSLKKPLRQAIADLLIEDVKNAANDLASVRDGNASTPQQKRWAEALKKKPNDELKVLDQLIHAKDKPALNRSLKSLKDVIDEHESWLGNRASSRTTFGEWYTSGRSFGKEPRKPGDFVILPKGDHVVSSIVGGNAASGELSSRFAGAFRSPMFELGDNVSVNVKGQNARVSLIIRHYELVGRGPTTSRLTQVLKTNKWQTVRFDTRLWNGERAYIEVLQNGGQFNQAAQTGGHVDGAYAVVGTASVDRAPQKRPIGRAWGIEDIAPATQDEMLKLLGKRLGEIAASWQRGQLTLEENDLLDALIEADVFDLNVSRSTALKKAVEEFRKVQAEIPAPTYVRSLSDGNGEDEPVYIRGSHKNLSSRANPRHFLDAIDAKPFNAKGSGRLQWAEALVSKDNPLTARVFVNRVWHHLFGRGIVYSPDDFGQMGIPPTHPALLDKLAHDFMADNWSMKRLIRRLALSSIYRMSSDASDASLQNDPNNLLLQHMPIRRLKAEAIRDTLLAVSGTLNPTRMYGPSVGVETIDRRSVYVQLRRRHMPKFLTTFDAPDATEPFGRRNVTSTPAQSLEMLNGSLAWKAADAWARRLISKSPEDLTARVQQMHREAFGRAATEQEIEWVRGLIKDLGGNPANVAKNHGIWKEICHTMLNRKELIHVF